MSVRVAVVIVNFNGAGHVADCLRSLFNQTFIDLSVTVLDNASTDGSADLIEREFPEVALLRSPVNVGFAAGSNAAIRHALDRDDPEFVFTLNNDVRLEERCLEELVRAMDGAPREVWSCQPKIYLDRGPGGPPVINNAGILVWRDGSAYNRGINQVDRGQFDDETDIFGTCAAASLYRRSALEEVGLFDEEFFAYLEDVDLAWRGRRAGFRSLLCPVAVCYHLHGASGTDPRRKVRMLERNRLLVLANNYAASDMLLSFAFTLYRFARLSMLGIGMRGSDGGRFAAYGGGGGACALAVAVAAGTLEGLGKAVPRLVRRRRTGMDGTLSRGDTRALLRRYSAPLSGLLSA